MNFGVSQTVITPPVGTWLSGFASRDHGAESVHDDLFAQCAAFREGATALMIIRADLLSFGADSVKRIRAALEEQAGVPGKNVMLAASHTHSGPAVTDLRSMGIVDHDYLQRMEDAIIRAALEALANTTPVEMSMGSAKVGGLSYVREGAGGLKPAHEIDLTLLKLTDVESGQTKGVVLNLACHAVVLGQYMISADFPGRVRAFVENELDTEMLFLQGACGDINPFRPKDNRTPTLSATPVERIEQLGRIIGEAAVEAAGNAVKVSNTGLQAVLTDAELPAAAPEREKLQKARDEAKIFLESEEGRKEGWHIVNVRNAELAWTTRMLKMLDEGTFPQSVKCPVQILRIGGVTVVGVAAEAFSGIERSVREHLGPDKTLFAGYTNGCLGYIASESAYEECRYATWVSNWLYDIPPLRKDADAVLIDTIKRAALP